MYRGNDYFNAWHANWRMDIYDINTELIKSLINIGVRFFFSFSFCIWCCATTPILTQKEADNWSTRHQQFYAFSSFLPTSSPAIYLPLYPFYLPSFYACSFLLFISRYISCSFSPSISYNSTYSPSYLFPSIFLALSLLSPTILRMLLPSSLFPLIFLAFFFFTLYLLQLYTFSFLPMYSPLYFSISLSSF